MPGGGALARVDEEATAFGQRTAPWNLHYLSMWPDPADTEQNIAYTRGLATAMKPWTTGRALKDKWDPANLFRHNQNTPPTAG